MSPYGTSEDALPTLHLAGKSVIRACIVSAVVARRGDTWIELATTANAMAKKKLSSADSAMLLQHGLREGVALAGRLRIDIVSDTAIRVRHTHAADIPANSTPMVIGTLPAPTRCDFVAGLTMDAGMCPAPWLAPVLKSDGLKDATAATHAALAFDTAAMRVVIGLNPFRIELRRFDGSVICGVGGLEKDHFNNWDAYATGVSRRRDGKSISHESFDLRPGEAIYGAGERFTKMNLVGQTVELWQRDGLGTTTPRSYKNIPFLVSTMGWGVYFNHSSAMTAWVGSMSACDVQLAADDDFLDYTVFAGSIAEVIGQYTQLTGRPEVPPAWTFGFWQSKISYSSADETLDIARRLRAARIPCDVIHLDTHWFKGDWYCDLEFDRTRFPDVAGYLAELKRLGFHVSLWQLPYVPEGSTYFADLQAVDGFVKDTQGQIIDVKICFTPGFSGRVGVIDFTNPRATQVYKDYLGRLFKAGAAVIKTDFGEDAPTAGVWYDGTPAHQMHNRYPLLYNQAAAEATAAGTDGGQVWARSSWAGSQRYPIPWGGDNSPNWHNLGPQWRGGLSLGLSGFTFWSEDIGGFVTDTNDHLLIRWMQGGLFHSHVRIHGAGIRELDRFKPETVNICREFLELRYRLLPYILAQSRICAATGQPTMRALVLDFQHDPTTWSIDDQWLFGTDLLVAPIMDAGTRRTAYLPPGTWYDWWTGASQDGGRWIEADAPLDRIPLWLRAGAIVPMGDVHQWVGDVPDAELELVLTPLDSDGERRLDATINGSAVVIRLVRALGSHRLEVTGCPVSVRTRWLGRGVLTTVV